MQGGVKDNWYDFSYASDLHTPYLKVRKGTLSPSSLLATGWSISFPFVNICGTQVDKKEGDGC